MFEAMATAEALETLRTYALEEQLSAGCDRRPLNRAFLDELGRTALPDNTPVYCHSDEALYQSLSGNRYKLDPAEDDPMLGGRFGGFFVRHSLNELSEPVEKAFFYVPNSSYNDEGYLCPVESSVLIGIVEELEDDELFADLAMLLANEVTFATIASLLEIYKSATPNKLHLYIGYMNAVATPISLFCAVYATEWSHIDRVRETGSSYGGPSTRFQIERGTTFGIVQNSVEDESCNLSILWGRNLMRSVELQHIVATELSYLACE